MSDIDTAAADSLKVLDPNRPIREADIPNGCAVKNATISLRARYSLYYAGSRNAGFMPCGSGMRNVLSIIETRA